MSFRAFLSFFAHMRSSNDVPFCIKGRVSLFRAVECYAIQTCLTSPSTSTRFQLSVTVSLLSNAYAFHGNLCFCNLYAARIDQGMRLFAWRLLIDVLRKVSSVSTRSYLIHHVQQIWDRHESQNTIHLRPLVSNNFSLLFFFLASICYCRVQYIIAN